MRHRGLAWMAGILAVCGAIQACGSTDPSRFYLLTPVASDAGAVRAAAPDAAIGLARVDLPDYLDRPQIVTRTSANQLHFAEFDRWAEPLQSNLHRVIAENLCSMLGADCVRPFPWRTGEPIDVRVSIDLIEFERAASGDFGLKARWTLSSGDGNRAIENRTTSLTVSAGGKDDRDYEAIVAAASQAVADLCREIAAAITEQGGQQGAKERRK